MHGRIFAAFQKSAVLSWFTDRAGAFLLPEDETYKKGLKTQLLSIIASLTPREQKVIRLRYGLDDGRPRTLEEVGHLFEVTRERIRQIEAKALRKLRNPNRTRRLKDFVEL